MHEKAHQRYTHPLCDFQHLKIGRASLDSNRAITDEREACGMHVMDMVPRRGPSPCLLTRAAIATILEALL